MRKVAIKQFISLLLILAQLSVFAQSTDQNYVQTWETKVAIQSFNDLNASTPVKEAIRTIQYFDGLGRLSQTVVPLFSPEGKSLVTPKYYNMLGMDDINFQPYVARTGEAVFSPYYESDLTIFYSNQFGDEMGMAPVEFEKSLLQRVVKQGAPGSPWQIDENGHYLRVEYLTNNNTIELKAIKWTVNNDQCVHNGEYPSGELFVVKTTSEDGSITYEFKDKSDYIVLKRMKAPENKYSDTYYVYDDLNLLRFVISPEGSNQITGSFNCSSVLAGKFVYYYKYDNRKRLIEKKLPGKDTEYTVYNKADMPIMYQDGNMRKMVSSSKAYEWQYTKYDVMGRIIITGITGAYPNQTRDQVQTLADSNVNCWETLPATLQYPKPFSNYYTNNTFPNTITGSIQTLDYYDTYHVLVKTINTFTPRPIVEDSELVFNPGDANFTVPLYDDKFIKGLPTISFVNAQGNLLPTVTYYDNRGRVLQVRQKGHIEGAYTISTNNYLQAPPAKENITGTIYGSFIKHKYLAANGTSQSIAEKYTYDYDDYGRLSLRKYQAGDVMAIHKVQNTYNPLGQLKQKIISEGTTVLQTIDYNYNIRGWLTSINNPAQVSSTGDLFGMNIYYNTTTSGLNNQALYSGNISATDWQTVQTTGSVTPNTTGRKAYVYSYDDLSRLTGASFKEYSYGAWQQTSKFDERIKSYDLNGNIKGLERKGSFSNWSTGTIDNLTYRYNGNQLISVDDAVAFDNGYDFYDNNNYIRNEYEYDLNGNVKKDVNKGIIELKYNHLNLPKEIYFLKDNKLDYYYDAAGNKLRQNVIHSKNLTKRTDFISNFVMINNAPAWINFDEGRVIMDGTNVFFTETHLKDHLGNARVTFTFRGNALEVRQVSSYYPFGMSIKGLSSQNFIAESYSPNEYLYNGKMFQDELELEWYDYGARFYDAAVGRWWSVDPLAEEFTFSSPYAYCFNNPINAVDPDGRFPVWAIVGAGLDYGLQVFDNYRSGKSGYDAWIGNVDFVDVGLAAINPTGKFKAAKTLLVEGTKSLIDITANEGVNLNTDVEEVATKTVLNTVVDVGAGKVANTGSKKAVQNANKEVATANQKLKTAERQAQRSPNSPKKAKNVNNAQSNAQSARNKQVRTKMLNSTVGQAPNATQKGVNAVTNRALKDEENQKR